MEAQSPANVWIWHKRHQTGYSDWALPTWAENGRLSSIDVWLGRFTSRILNDGWSLFCAEIGIRAASPDV